MISSDVVPLLFSREPSVLPLLLVLCPHLKGGSKSRALVMLCYVSVEYTPKHNADDDVVHSRQTGGSIEQQRQQRTGEPLTAARASAWK